MNLIAAFAGILLGILAWWLAVRRLTTRPWEAQGTLDGRGTAEMLGPAPQRIGLWVFLAVVTAFFGLFITAYSIRMNPHDAPGFVGDWRALAEPPILWLNTILLVLASVGMQVARSAAGRGQAALTRAGLLAGGVLALGFLAGQFLAWRQLQAGGYYAAGNPANAFYYVLTGLHGLHLLGGLLVWSRTVAKLRFGRARLGTVRLTIELCTVYWHYLLAVWLVLFGLLLVT